MALIGENNHQWRGGVTPEYKKARHCLEYKIWRTGVFKRDNFTCVICGKYGGELEADHIKPFAKYSELRYDLNNGRTLCIDCHTKTDTYLNKTTIVFEKRTAEINQVYSEIKKERGIK